MKTIIEEKNDKYFVVLEGELDTAAAAEVEQVLQPLYNTEGKDVCIDCEKLEYISSSGLRILMNLLKTARSKGERVVLKNVNEVIRDVLDLTGFVSYFDFE
jgi:anti-anti-sigma factor